MTGVQDFLKGLARANHPLLRRIVDFNTRFAARIPAASEGRMLPELPRGLLPARTPFAARRFAPVLPLMFGQKTTPWALDFRQPSRRIALLPPDLLVRLSCWYGLAAFRREVGELIRRDAVMALLEQDGELRGVLETYRSLLLPG